MPPLRDLDDAVVMLLPALVKARHDSSGRRIVEVEASTEEVDADGDVVLQSALLASADSFVRNGHLDIDHYSEFGHRIGIPDPLSWIVGRPLEVKALAGRRTSVVGEISRSLDGVDDPRRNRFDELWASLRRDPPVRWFSSIFGYPDDFADCSAGGACDGTGATRYVIRSIDWRSLAFTRTPKNTALTGAARIVTAKAFVAMAKAGMTGVPHSLPIGPMPSPMAKENRARPLQVLEPHHLGDAVLHLYGREPTEAQARAGNYPKGHVVVAGLHVSIETPMGGIRRGVGRDGVPWAVRMPADYGYVKSTEGADGDHLDVYLGSQAHRAGECAVWVVDQVDADTRAFDEHKAMLGFPDYGAMRRAYVDAFSDGRGAERMGAVTAMDLEGFREWLAADTSAPLAYVPPKDASALLPPTGAFPSSMDDVWDSRACKSCGVHDVPSLLGYRAHFAKCLSYPPGVADVAAHALMHRRSMMDNPFTAPPTLRPATGAA